MTENERNAFNALLKTVLCDPLKVMSSGTFAEIVWKASREYHKAHEMVSPERLLRDLLKEIESIESITERCSFRLELYRTLTKIEEKEC